MTETTVELRLATLPGTLSVLKLRGTESLSHPFAFDVTVAAPPVLPVDALLEADATLLLDTTRAPGRILAGYVAKVRTGARLADGSRSTRLRVVPHWSRLALRRSTRIFQALGTPDIVSMIAREHGLVVRSELLRPPPVRTYCVQYRETDLEFVERLLAEEGVTYQFDDLAPGSTKHAIVLVDDPARYAALIGSPNLELRSVNEEDEAAGVALQLEEHHVTAFELSAASLPKTALVTDYDFRRPATLAEAAQPPLGGQDRWYEHQSPYGEDQPIVDASTALAQVSRKRVSARGRSVCRRLAPGRVVHLERDDGEPDASYAVTAIRHELSPSAASTGRALYSNRFEAVRADDLLRPARPLARVHQALETATVVGPPGEAIYTDEFGRVKVQFHWDRDGQRDERSSCWLRVSQSWAGAGWGAQFLPRVGMEVIVGFLGGDLDRPTVLGCVENATHRAPFTLPEQRTRSGVRTESVGAPNTAPAGFSELSFEDRWGAEEVRVRAQRDMSLHVLHDTRSTVDNHASLAVGGNLDVSVLGSQTIRIGGLLLSEYEGDAQSTCRGTSVSRVDADMEIAVGASQRTKVVGASTSSVGGDRTDYIKGALTVRAEAKHLLLVGNDEVEGEAELHSTGGFVVAANRRTLVSAGEALVLQCGDSSIEITPTQILLRSKALVLEGESIHAAADGPSFELSDKAVLMSDTFRVLTKNASLDLDDGATLRGTNVAFGSGAPRPPTEAVKRGIETRNVSVQLSDARFHPYANKRWEARAQGLKLEGVSGGDGTVSLDVPKDAQQAFLTVWLDTYPTGRRKEVALDIAELPPVDTIPGLQTRLKNLGYYFGGTDGDRIDSPTAEALRAFKKDHGLADDGISDPPTHKALVARYGA